MGTKLETINELINELPLISNLYNANCVKRTGKTTDTDEFYTEIIANELLRNLNEFDKIPTVTRTETYYRENHCQIQFDICESNRNEEIFAKRITGLKLDGLGLIKDYQVPLKDTLKNSGLGKIDLISFNEETKTLYLIELKYEANKETLLKASLESFTYFKVVDKTKLINDYFNNQKFILNKVFNPIDPDTVNVKPAVLVVPGCKAYDELEELEIGDRQKMKALALALDISYFTFEFYPREIRL